MKPLRLSIPDSEPAFQLAQALFDRYQQDPSEGGILSTIHELGLLWAWIPKWMGGGGLHPLSFFSFTFALSQKNAGLCNIIGAHYAAFGILSSARAYSQIRFLVQAMKGCDSQNPGILCLAITEPDAGSDFEDPDCLNRARVSTQAIPDGDGYKISGQKMYVSNAPIARWVVISAYINLKKPLDSGVLGVLPLERSGITLGKREQKIGQNACPNSMLFFDQVVMNPVEICTHPSNHLSQFLITDSLGPGRIGAGVMAMGILASIEGSESTRLKSLEIELEALIRTLKKSHLAYRSISFLNPLLSWMGNRADRVLSLEKASLSRTGPRSGTRRTFQDASRFKARASRELWKTFEDLYGESSQENPWENAWFQQQLLDGRLLEIIEGTTEVCEQEAGIQSNIDLKFAQSIIHQSHFGFISQESEEQSRMWMKRNESSTRDPSWSELIAGSDQKLAYSALYGLAFQNVNGAEAILEASPIDRTSREYHLRRTSILVGAADRAFELARQYSLERYQGGRLIHGHAQVAGLLLQSYQTVTRLKEELSSTSPSLHGVRACVRLARDTAQVFGGMSYMEEHLISHLFRSILRLSAELIRSPLFEEEVKSSHG